MNLSPEFYKKINDYPNIVGNDLIDLILKENSSDEVFNVIVEIGCGCGELTEVLSKRVRHNRLIALDIKPEMIQFANQNHKTETIEYVIQDISKPWNELSSTLRDLERKVSLIFSNLALHWIENKEIVAQNFQKLLSKNGCVYINIGVMYDFNANLDEEQRKQNEKLIKIPSIKEQINIWENLMTKNGITILSTDLSEKLNPMNKKHLIGVLTAGLKIYEMYVISNDAKEKEMVPKKFVDLIFWAFTTGNKGTPIINAYREFQENEAVEEQLLNIKKIQFTAKKI